MKKYLILGFAVLQSLFCFAQSKDSARLCRQEIYKSFQKPYLSYTVEKFYCDEDGCDTIRADVYMNRKRKEPVVYAVFGQDNAIKYSEESAIWIDRATEEVLHYSRQENATAPTYYELIEVNLFNAFLADELVLYSFDEEDNGINIVRVARDTAVNGKMYDVWFGNSGLETDDSDDSTIFYEEVAIFFDRKADFVDCITFREKKLDGTPLESEEEFNGYRYTNVSYKKRDAEFEKVFSRKNPYYTLYEHCDEAHPTYSRNRCDTMMTVLTDEILDWALVDTKKDTTTLREQDTWLLVETWFNGCADCKHWIKGLTDQRQQKGQSDVEAAGVKVICISPYVRDFDRMRETEQKLVAEGMLYSANGMQKVVNMVRFPAFYLISPDKKIVYSTVGLPESNEQFIQAKKAYEQKAH